MIVLRVHGMFPLSCNSRLQRAAFSFLASVNATQRCPENAGLLFRPEEVEQGFTLQEAPMSLSVLFVILAAVCFGLAAFGVPSSRVNLGWLGAMFYAIASLISGVVLRG